MQDARWIIDWTNEYQGKNEINFELEAVSKWESI